MSSNQNSHISQAKWDICSRPLIVFDVCNVTNCILLDHLSNTAQGHAQGQVIQRYFLLLPMADVTHQHSIYKSF